MTERLESATAAPTEWFGPALTLMFDPFDHPPEQSSHDDLPPPTSEFPRTHGPRGDMGVTDPLLRAADHEVELPESELQFWEPTSNRRTAVVAAIGVLGGLLLPSFVGAMSLGAPIALETASTVAPISPVPIADPLPSSVVTIPVVPSPGGSTDSDDTTTTAQAAGSTASADTVASASAQQSQATTSSTAAGSTAATTQAATTAAPATTQDVATTAATSAPETTAVVAAAVCATEYTVGQGDFWIRIAEQSGTPLADLLSLNDATVNTPIHADVSVVCLPPGASKPSPPPTVAAPRQPTAAQPEPSSTQPAATQPPATQPPATTTTTTTTQPPRSYSGSEVEQIIRSIWPDDLEEKALDIAWRESNHRPEVRNFCCFGLFQIYYEVHKGWLADMGVNSASDLYDPVVNTRAAYALYQRAGGWHPWSTA